MHLPSESVAALVLAPPQVRLNPIQKTNRFLVRLPLLPAWLFEQLAQEGSMYGKAMTWANAREPRQGPFDFHGPTAPSIIGVLAYSLMGIFMIPFIIPIRLYQEAANIRAGVWGFLGRVARVLVGQEPL